MNIYTYNPYIDVYSNYLEHFGILGMHWGRRKQKEKKGRRERKRATVSGLIAAGLIGNMLGSSVTSKNLNSIKGFAGKTAKFTKTMAKHGGKAVKAIGKTGIKAGKKIGRGGKDLLDDINASYMRNLYGR